MYNKLKNEIHLLNDSKYITIIIYIIFNELDTRNRIKTLTIEH